LAEAVVVEGKGEGEGSGREAASGSSSPSSATEKRQEEEFCQDLLGFREGEAVQIFFPPLGRLAKEGKEREKRMGKARVHLAEFKFKFEFLQTRFENLSK
jgi:hypothetical protein